MHSRMKTIIITCELWHALSGHIEPCKAATCVVQHWLALKASQSRQLTDVQDAGNSSMQIERCCAPVLQMHGQSIAASTCIGCCWIAWSACPGTPQA